VRRRSAVRDVARDGERQSGGELMRPQTVVINTGLALVLLAAAVGAVLSVNDPTVTKAIEQAAPVSRGAVTTTVNAAGNLGSPRIVGLPFAGTPGLVTAVYTEVGKTVEPGEKLATVDDRSARNELAHAKATVASAEAQIMAAEQGQTPAEARLDQANIEVALQQVSNAQDALARARAKLADDTTTQDKLVSTAEQALANTYAQVTRSDQRTTTGDLNESTGIVPPSPTQGTTHQTTTDNSTVTTTRSDAAIYAARQALEQAKANRSVQLLADEQDIRKTDGDAKLTARQLDAARATARVNAQGPKPDKLASAKAQLAEAQAQVADAQAALDNTVLRAPFRGTVVDIAGSVGETPLAATRGSVANMVVPAGPGSAENRSAATQSGFVILADMSHQHVTAQINEADIGKVAPGQQASVTFPALGSTVKGTVSSVDEQETVVNNVVQYKVEIGLDDAPPTRKVGQSASVQIVTASRQNVLSVPNAAIISAGGGSIVTVRRDQRLMKVPVSVGLVGDSATEISSSLLRDGDVVVLPPGAEPDTKPTASFRSTGGGLGVK